MLVVEAVVSEVKSAIFTCMKCLEFGANGQEGTLRAAGADSVVTDYPKFGVLDVQQSSSGRYLSKPRTPWQGEKQRLACQVCSVWGLQNGSFSFLKFCTLYAYCNLMRVAWKRLRGPGALDVTPRVF